MRAELKNPTKTQENVSEFIIFSFRISQKLEREKETKLVAKDNIFPSDKVYIFTVR